MPKPGYMTPVTPGPLDVPCMRTGNNVGLSTIPVSGTWGSDARHVYSKQEPWSADESLISIENSGSPSPLILDGFTYLPKYAPCGNYDLWDYRWHPSRAHPHDLHEDALLVAADRVRRHRLRRGQPVERRALRADRQRATDLRGRHGPAAAVRPLSQPAHRPGTRRFQLRTLGLLDRLGRHVGLGQVRRRLVQWRQPAGVRRQHLDAGTHAARDVDQLLPLPGHGRRRLHVQPRPRRRGGQSLRQQRGRARRPGPVFRHRRERGARLERHDGPPSRATSRRATSIARAGRTSTTRWRTASASAPRSSP